jgi:hypothetical protein
LSRVIFGSHGLDKLTNIVDSWRVHSLMKVKKCQKFIEKSTWI